MKIGPVEVGSGQPCRFVAEISNNHNGSFSRALRLIDAAKESGCDLVKFQCYTPDELVTLRGDGPAPDPWGAQGWSMRQLYEKAQTPHGWFPGLVMHCQQIGMPWFSSVFGPESLALLETLGCPAYKIARLDNRTVWGPLGKSINAPLIVSESQHGESRCAADIRLYCPPGYPQPNAGMFSTEFDEPHVFDAYNSRPDFNGFSYHGTDTLPCIVAATLGAKLVEFHLQLFSEPSELESNVSLTPKQVREMIDTVRRVEGMLA